MAILQWAHHSRNRFTESRAQGAPEPIKAVAPDICPGGDNPADAALDLLILALLTDERPPPE